MYKMRRKAKESMWRYVFGSDFTIDRTGKWAKIVVISTPEDVEWLKENIKPELDRLDKYMEADAYRKENVGASWYITTQEQVDYIENHPAFDDIPALKRKDEKVIQETLSFLD